jgi:hypothetical protein
MNHAQRVFEAIMRAKGHTDFSMKGGKYTNGNLSVRWNYFQLGWEMHEATKPSRAAKGSA